MSLLRMIFGWWHHATFGTLATIWFSGTYVGTDKFGNRYYQSKKGSRCWVTYAGTVEASRVPPAISALSLGIGMCRSAK